MTNSVDPDQTPHSAASDLDRHCLLTPICPKTLVILQYYEYLIDCGFLKQATSMKCQFEDFS